MLKLIGSSLVATAFCTALAPLPAAAQELSLGAMAVRIPEAAVAALGFRDEGKPREFLTKPLPPKEVTNNRTAREMHQVVEDVYGFPELRGLTYFVYTQERFQQELRGKEAPTRFEQVAEKVFACQAPVSSDDWSDLNYCLTFKKSTNCTAQPKWQALIQCVTSVVHAYPVAK